MMDFVFILRTQYNLFSYLWSIQYQNICLGSRGNHKRDIANDDLYMKHAIACLFIVWPPRHITSRMGSFSKIQRTQLCCDAPWNWSVNCINFTNVIGRECEQKIFKRKKSYHFFFFSWFQSRTDFLIISSHFRGEVLPVGQRVPRFLVLPLKGEAG